MEVLCDRCQTEYDFDDALVSERGTTVKCTNCGHQFRIYRPKAAPAPPERWLVRTVKGVDLVFTSLRDLQRAIGRGEIGRDDTLTREGMQARRLTHIAELEPFFPAQPTPRFSAPRERRSTPLGLGGPRADQRELETKPNAPSAGSHLPQDELQFDEATLPRFEPAASNGGKHGPEMLRDEPGFDPPTQRKPGSAPPPTRAPMDTAPSRVVIKEYPPRGLTPTPSDVSASYARPDEAFTDPRYVTPTKARGSTALKWVVGVGLVVGLVIAGATLGRSYMVAPNDQAAAPVAQEARVRQLLEEGERELLDGDIEGAKASFDKASVLAEGDPRPLVQLARLANARADVLWLKQHLLTPEQRDALELTTKQLALRLEASDKASEQALAAAPDSPDGARVRLDAFRLSNKLQQARALVARLASRSSEPEVAYVLGALEMAESSPNWTAAIERLQAASAAERDLGRARGALVYALGRAGQLDRAATELAILEQGKRPHPLVLELKVFLARAKAAEPAATAGMVADAAAPGEGKDVDPTALPVAGGGPAAGSDAVPAGSHQQMMDRAHAARKAGDLVRAEQLYRAVLARFPNDTEALAALGDIARARGDKGASVGYYEEVAKQNPSYLPALLGLADAKWDAGDRTGAVALYRQVLDRTGGQGSYAARAKQRISEASAPVAPPTTEPSAPPAPTEPPAGEPSPAPSPTATSTTPPGVDTSDLPGWSP